MMVSTTDGQAANANVQTMRIEVELNRNSKVSSSNLYAHSTPDSPQKLNMNSRLPQQQV